MKIAIVTDAWPPQVNGVVKTLSTTVAQLNSLGHEVLVVEPSQFATFPCPTYPEIRLAWRPGRRVNQLLREFQPQALHIATEGTLGLAARRWARAHKFTFTTSYHTQYPEYLRARWPIPVSVSYAFLRWFHGGAVRTMTATPSLETRLRANGFRNIVRWSRGVDLELFKPYGKEFLDFPRPIAIFVGRVAVEKNIEAFLKMNWDGTKVVVGDGPAREALQGQYPDAKFPGYQYGEELARHVAAADVFVFPSRTDTFGLVLLEAMACGTPIAAYPVMGPVDVVKRDVTGKLDENLERAARSALQLDPAQCREHALRYTWSAATEQFLRNLSPNLHFDWAAGRRRAGNAAALADVREG